MKHLFYLTLTGCLFILLACSKENYKPPTYPTPSQQEMLEMFQGKYINVNPADTTRWMIGTYLEFDPPFETPRKMVWKLWGTENEVDIHGTYTTYYWYDHDVKYYYAYSLNEWGYGYTEYEYQDGEISYSQKASIVITEDKESFTWYQSNYSLPSRMWKVEKFPHE